MLCQQQNCGCICVDVKKKLDRNIPLYFLSVCAFIYTSFHVSKHVAATTDNSHICCAHTQHAPKITKMDNGVDISRSTPVRAITSPSCPLLDIYV